MLSPRDVKKNAALALTALLAALATALAMASLVSARDVPFPNKHIVNGNYVHPTAIYAADLDSDGNTDILGVSTTDGEVTWWESDGTPRDGGWITHTLTNTLSGAGSVHVADVNGDGDLDILATGWSAQEVVWWENDGTPEDEGWVTHIVTDTFGNPDWVRGADIDGDGDVDILCATWNTTSDIIWWENTSADGTAWSMHTITDTIGAAVEPHAADVDGDGDLDVVAAAIYPGLVAWWENADGDGSLWDGHIVDDAVSYPYSVYPADVDGDGDVDILGADYEPDRVFWWENTDGQGTGWAEHTIDDWHQGATAVYASDLDGDGDMDALGAALIDDDVTWWENSAGDGTAWAEHPVDTNLDHPTSVFAADVDGDGDMDYLASASGSADDIIWWENETIHRSASFPLKETPEDSLPVWDVRSADVDGDGDQDLLGAATNHTNPHDGMISWWRNNGGTGSDWTEFIVLDSGFDGAVAIRPGDFDGDGDIDFLAAGWQENDVAWWENSAGNGSFWLRHDLDTEFPAPYTVDIADVDQDGDLDAVAGGDSTISWWENNGTTTGWTEHGIHYEHAHNIRKLEAVDIDGDGDIDVAGACNGKSYIAWWENDGTGLVWTRSYISGEINSYPGAQSLHAADVDGDGDVDVLGTNGAAGQAPADIVLFENDGSGGGWTPHTVVSEFYGCDGVYASDLDLDGDLDLVGALPSVTSFGLRWLENTTGDASTWTPHTIALPYGGRNVYAADVDGDADPDILGAETGLGDVSLWRNRGGQFALETTDTAPGGGFLQGEMDDMLRVKMTHNGVAGDRDEELASLDLLFEESAGDPLTSTEANALIADLHVYLDDGSQIFDPVWDTLITTVDALSLAGGVLSVALPDGAASVQVTYPVPKTFFVVPELASDAHQQTPSQFRVTHLTEASSSAEDRDHDIPLVLEYAEDVASGSIVLVNHAPNAYDDHPSTPEDSEVFVGVTGNDSDPDSDPLTVVGVTQPQHGTSAVSGPGQVVYTPTLNYHGSDNFSYVASDGALTDTATVHVSVTPVNDPPEVDAGGDQTVEEGQQVDFAGAFTDPDPGGGHTIAWYFGDGDTAAGSLTPSHTYRNNEFYTVHLAVDDQSGGVVTDSLQVTVTNVAPSVDAGPDWEVDVGYVLTITATFTDPGVEDLHSAYFNLGDGNEGYGHVDQLAGTAWAGHPFTAPGTYTVTVTITDDDGGQGVDTVRVDVADFKVFLPLTVRH